MQPLTKNEELEQLCAELRNPYERDFATFDRAAEEIERLAKNQKDEYVRPLTEAEELVQILRHSDPMYVGRNIRRQAADKIESLVDEVKKLKDELDLVRQDEERFIYD
jgi:hypothetical protein